MARKIIIFLILLIAQVSFADDTVRIEQSVDVSTITIGDRINLDVKIFIPEDYALKEPERTETLGEWSVKDVRSYQDTKDTSKHIKYTLTAYTTGQITIPELAIKYIDNKQKESEIRTRSVNISIESVISKVKGQPALRDIAPVMKLKVPASVYIMWTAIILAILGLGGVFYYLYRKKKAKVLPEDLPPPIPPDVLALEALEKLKKTSLIKDGKIKEYYVILIDIVRDFLSGTYRIETRDMTTGEIMAGLKKKEHDKARLSYIRDFLEEGDLVKFAKYRPDEKDCWKDFETAREIVIRLRS